MVTITVKFKGKSITIVLYVGCSVVALVGVASLINNILLFKHTVAQYVAQGYPSADVVKTLIPSQLLPGIFEPVAVYGGIALLLWGAGKINQRLSMLFAGAEDDKETLANNVGADNDGLTNTEAVNEVETVTEVSEVTEEKPASERP